MRLIRTAFAGVKQFIDAVTNYAEEARVHKARERETIERLQRQQEALRGPSGPGGVRSQRRTSSTSSSAPPIPSKSEPDHSKHILIYPLFMRRAGHHWCIG